MIARSAASAAGSLLRAAVNASARRTARCLAGPGGPHACSAFAAHAEVLSSWHALQALGIPKRVVFSGAGTEIEWSRIRALMEKTVRGMWHSTHEAPGPSTR